MKYDKCGGAAVLGIMQAVNALQLPSPVVGMIAAAENMISEDAYRRLEAIGIKQDWNWALPKAGKRGTPTGNHYLKWGFDVRRMSTAYDYFNERNLDDPLEEIRFGQPSSSIHRTISSM